MLLLLCYQRRHPALGCRQKQAPSKRTPIMRTRNHRTTAITTCTATITFQGINDSSQHCTNSARCRQLPLARTCTTAVCLMQGCWHGSSTHFPWCTARESGSPRVALCAASTGESTSGSDSGVCKRGHGGLVGCWQGREGCGEVGEASNSACAPLLDPPCQQHLLCMGPSSQQRPQLSCRCMQLPTSLCSSRYCCAHVRLHFLHFAPVTSPCSGTFNTTHGVDASGSNPGRAGA
mmetsp:Transcript_30677/g.79900  ORF Transcript_30677/g.79900 Transcript_30677/m.79900 type:complete len:234 (+) Transcript_30677:345-1046(+)